MKTKLKKAAFKIGLAIIALIKCSQSAALGQAATAEFTIGAEIVQDHSNRFGVNLDWPYYNNWTHDPGMEPLAVNLKGTATGGGGNFITNTGSVDTSYEGAFTDGFFNGASIRIYRVVSGAVTLIREATVTQYSASPTSGYRIDLDSQGATVQAGDVYYLNLIIDNVPIASVDPSIQGNISMADSWSPIGNVEQFRDRSTVPPVDGGQTSMRLHTDQEEYVGMFQHRYGSQDQWMESLDPGEPYRMELWLRQENRNSDEVVLWMDEHYSQINTVLTGINGTWTQFQFDFIAPTRPGPGSLPIPQGLVFEGPGTLWVDNFRVYKTTEAPFTYQQDKIDTLLESNPTTIRLWGGVSNEQLGSNIEDWTNSEALSLRQYNPNYGAQYSDSSLKLPTALPVVEELNASPWLVVGPYHSESDWLSLIEYLAGPTGTPFGDKRVSQGRTEPWSDAFPLIYIEYGNESWLPFFEWQTDPVEYGQFAEHFFTTIKSSPYYPQIANKLVFVLNGALDQSTTDDFGHVAIQHCPSAHMVDVAPYIGGWESEVEFGGGAINDAGYQEYLLFHASRIKFHTDRHAQSRDTLSALGFDYDLVTYEFGPGYQLPTGTTPVHHVMEAYGKSLAAGVATMDVMLDLQRNRFFSGNFFEFNGNTSYATHTAPEAGFRPHPAWQAVQLANQHAINPRVYSRALHTPTLFVEGEDEFPNVHAPLLDLHAYRDGDDYTAIILSRSLDNETLVTLHLPFDHASSGTAHMLTGDPRTNNTSQDLIGIQSEAFTPVLTGNTYTFPMPPGSIYVLEFTDTSLDSSLPPQPVVSLAEGQLSPTTQNHVEFHVSFNQIVNGLTASDVLFTGTAQPSNIELYEASPFDGTQFIVSVSLLNVSGSVDITLPQAAATNSANMTSLSSIATHAPIAFTEIAYPSLVSPSANSTLPGISADFTWSAGDFDIDTFILEVGSQPEWDDVYGGTFTGQTFSTFVDQIPNDGRTLYVRLWYIIGWQWAYMDSEVQAYEAPPLPDPAIASPQSSTISGSTVTFGWSNNGNTVDRWWLDIGTSQGGGEIHEGNYPGSQLSDTITGLPANGATIHARLWYRINWNWAFIDNQFQSNP